MQKKVGPTDDDDPLISPVISCQDISAEYENKLRNPHIFKYSDIWTSYIKIKSNH